MITLDEALRKWACSCVCPNTMEPTNEYEMRAVKSYMVNGLRLLQMSQTVTVDGIDNFLNTAKEHYWDTCEPQKELILKHLESIAYMVRGR